LGRNFGKGDKIGANLIRFGQNQHLASSKTFELLRIWTRGYLDWRSFYNSDVF